MIEEVSAQYLKELQAEKEELEKNYSDNAHAIKLLQNGENNLFSRGFSVDILPLFFFWGEWGIF